MAEGLKVSLPRLNGENYFTWKYKMELYLRKEKVWSAVAGTRPEVPEVAANVTPAMVATAQARLDAYLENDEMARALIGLCVEDNQLAIIRNDPTARDTWNTLRDYYQRNTFANKVMIMRRIWDLKLPENGDMDKHIREMSDSFQKLVDMGEEQLSDSWKTAIFLSSMPPSYDTLIQTLEGRPDADLTLSLAHSKCISEYMKRKNNGQVSTNGDDSVLKTSTPVKKTCYFCHKRNHLKKDCYKFKAWLKNQPGEGNQVNTVEENHLFLVSDKCVGDEWIVDSGATTHVTNNKRLFETLNSTTNSQVIVANNTKESAYGKGTCTISLVSENGDLSSTKLNDVLYTPNIQGNMISVNKLMKSGFVVVFDKGICEIKHNNKQVAVADNIDGLFRLRQSDTVNACSENKHKKGCLHHWHRMFGHRNPEAIKAMYKNNLIDGMKLLDCGIKVQCETCMEAKTTRLPFPKQSLTSTNAVLDLIHSDICGPMQVESMSKKRYVLTLIDDYSRYTEIYFLHNKSEAIDKIREYVAMVENKFNTKPKIFRSDRGGEFTGNEFKQFMYGMGIKLQYTAPYSPQQNGVAERKNRSLIEMARCMLTDADLPKYLWAEAVNTANYIQNRTLTKGAEQIPYHLWNDEKPNAVKFEIFGTKCYVHVPTEKRRKLDNTAREMFFIGYEDGSKAYRLYDAVNRKLVVSRDVRFIHNETHSGGITVDLSSGVKRKRVNVHHNEGDENDDASEIDDSENNQSDDGEERNPNENNLQRYRERSENESDSDSDEDSATSGDTVIRSSAGASNFESTLEEEYGELSTSFGDLSMSESEYVPTEGESDTDQQGSPRVSSRANKGIAPQRYQAQKITTQMDEPKTLQEAISNENKTNWIEAMKDEIASMKQNETWELCVLPTDRKAIGSKWIYKIKTDADGKVNRFKARLVAQGFSQKFGTDYDQVFAPVARQTTFRILLSVASKERLQVHHLDVKTAFLNGKLTETIYMKQPPGFEDDNKQLVCKLKKSIYGLKQAAKSWNDTIHQFLTKIGFMQSKADQCLYTKRINDEWAYILVYVDDIVLVAKTTTTIHALKQIIANEFDIKDLGEIKQYLGIEVTRDEKGIFHLNQAKYINKVVNEFGLDTAKISNVPMQPNYGKSAKEDDRGVLLSNTQYQKLLGCLLYISINTRPDISASVSILAQKVSMPQQEDWHELKRVLKYLKGTANFKLPLAAYGGNDHILYGYSDANWAEDRSDRKSNSGHVFLVNGGTVCWSSRKQSMVALSTCEAEFIALSEACRAALWIRRVLIDLKQKVSDATMIYEDNQSCLKLIEGEERLSNRSKHIDTRFHFVKDYVDRSIVRCVYCPTDDMLADILTKALSHGKFSEHRFKFGLHD